MESIESSHVNRPRRHPYLCIFALWLLVLLTLGGCVTARSNTRIDPNGSWTKTVEIVFAFGYGDADGRNT